MSIPAALSFPCLLQQFFVQRKRSRSDVLAY